MITVPQIARRRIKKRYLGRHNLYGSLALGCSLLVSLFLLLGGMSISYYYVILTRDLPSLELFSSYLEPPNGILLQPTIFYDRTGENELLRLINPAAIDARYLLVDRSANTGAEYFSPELIRATIFNLEPDFWETQDSPLGWLFNKEENILAQQLVSEIALWDEPQGKLHELRVRLLASQVIHEFGRTKVLEWYLNFTKYGHLVYGADAAAHVYLGKSASELNLAEGILITAIAKAPDINPHTVPDLILGRQKVLIQSFLDQGLISVEEARSASMESFIFREEIDLHDDFQPFTNLVLEQLVNILSRDQLERGGIKIITSMDYNLQIQTQCVMYGFVSQSGSNPRGLSTIDGSPCESALLLPTMFVDAKDFPDTRRATSAISDPNTGQLLAFVKVTNKADDAVPQSKIQAGTALTPFIYLTSFASGSNPGTMVWDIPEEDGPFGNDNLEADLYEQIEAEEPYRGPIRLRIALVNDYLRPTLKLIDQTGDENVITTLLKFGLFSQNTFNSQTNIMKSIFTEEVGFLDIVRAYGILANQGVIAGQVNIDGSLDLGISGVLRLEDGSGNVLVDWSAPQLRSIVSSQLTYLISNILSDERARWESLGHPNSLEIGRTVAVKMSHTLDKMGSWVVGYDPNKVVGVWIESLQDDKLSILPQLSSGLWHAIIQYALRENQIVSWQVPPGISSVDVCDPSGLLPTSICPYVVTETFLSGQEPNYFDTLYRSFQINRETGNLATVFTPPELIVEHVYLVFPPQAEEWARSEGYPLAPKNYDAVGVASDPLSHVRIDSPEMFSQIGGRIPIRGSADGEDFSYYRIQVGQGLNPQSWIQLGEDFADPVDDGILAIWDTRGLSGLFVIQLLVVHQDQHVEIVNQQVTIDNQAPEIYIQSPEEDQFISVEENKILILQADVNDDLEVAQVDFYLDDRLLTTLTLPPYIAPWESILGEHRLLVKAQDLAGNVSEDSIEFTVSR